MIITLVNCVSVKLTNWVQNLFTLGKVAGLLMIIALGIYSLYMGLTMVFFLKLARQTIENVKTLIHLGQVDNFKAPFENTEANPGKLALAFYAGMYSYSGWSFLNYVVEEIKNPNK